MRFWKNWLEQLMDPAGDAYERRYRLLSLSLTLVLIPWSLSSLVLGINGMRVLAFGAVGMLFFGSSLLAMRYGKSRQAALIVIMLAVFFLIPTAFIFMGGVRSGAPYWCLLIMVYIICTIEGRLKYALIALDLLVTSGSYLFTYYHQDMVSQMSVREAYLNSMTQLTGTLIVCGSMFWFQFYMSRQERDILKAQRDEIEEMNRAQNRFFSSMSHEIRTPINTIIGLNEMNMRDRSLSDEIYTNNRNIQGASKMLLALINDILDMSKIESGKMDIVPVAYDTGAMLSEIVNMIWGRATGKGLKFSVEVDPTLPVRLYADEVRIKQVLINLLNNAVKYTQSGSVKLMVQCDRTDNVYARVTYRVEDTGMGIKKEAIPDLFDAFKRVDQEANRNIEGTGLGLSIVKQIVDLMDGEITVDSIYTKGSTFSATFTQEIVDDAEIGELSLSAAKAAKRDVYLQSFEAPAASLLIVDDNELNLQVESKLLEATRMQIDLAMSGRECLSMTFRKKYDVIFMDHLMPEMDGIETLKEIRAQRGGSNRETPVLAVTANAGSENQALYAREGFDGYLVKPVTGEQLEDTLLGVLPREKVILTGTATVRAQRETISGRHKRSRGILVSTESGADLPADLVKKYRISVINSRIRTNESVFYDNLDIESDGLLDYLDAEGTAACSEPPTVEAFRYFFAEGLSQAQHVVHISLGHSVSEGYANACEAAGSFDRVLVTDSDSFSCGTGILALYAAHLAEQEDDVTRFLESLAHVKRLIRSSFLVDTADYLARGGRITARMNRWMKALMLHPVLKMKRGVLSAGGFFMGERDRYRKQYIRRALKGGGAIDLSLLIIVYAGMPEEELKRIRQIVEDEVPFRRILFVKTSGAIAVNSGRGCFALMYCVREDETDRGVFDFLPADTGAERKPEQEEEVMPEYIPAREEAGAFTEAASARDTEKPLPEDGTALQKLYTSTDMLRYENALEYLSGEDLMEKTLRVFYDSIGKNADEIEAFLDAEDFDNFTVKVHALKSSARLIGAEKLSELAARMEEYGKFIRS